jgi:hypothetical protein
MSSSQEADINEALMKGIDLVADQLLLEAEKQRDRQARPQIWTRPWILRSRELGASDNFICSI